MADDNAPEDEGPDNPEPEPESAKDDGDDLGEAGKKALKAERTRATKAEKQAKALEAELEQLRQSQMTESEKAIAEARAEGRQAAHAEVVDRLVRAEIRVAAAGKLADPGDASAFLGDLTEFATDSGEVDQAAIASAIDALVKDKPYLAVNGLKPSSLPGGGAKPSDGSDFNSWLRQQAGHN